jgi:tRNA 2-thiouridine synthesizing protein A
MAGRDHVSAKPPATLDLRGVACPLAWAKATVRLETLARGVVIDLVIDDPRSLRDLPRAAEASGHHVVEVDEAGPPWRVRIEV